jgi:hypothetical protein
MTTEHKPTSELVAAVRAGIGSTWTSDEDTNKRKYREAIAALDGLEEQLRTARDDGYDEAQADIFDAPVCSTCGMNHDRDESAMCETGEVVTFREWRDSASRRLEQLEAARAEVEEWKVEAERGKWPKEAAQEFFRMRSALAAFFDEWDGNVGTYAPTDDTLALMRAASSPAKEPS